MTHLSSAPAGVKHVHYTSPTTMIVVATISLSLATLAVLLRFFARTLTRSRYCTDDWLVLAALILTGGFVGSIIYCLVRIQTLTGGLTVNTSIINQQLVYAAEILYYLIQSCLKFSILAFYWRLFNSTYLRYYIYWVTLIVSLWSVTAVIIAVIQCLPIKTSWTMESGQSYQCINLQAFFLGISIPHIILDLILIVMPIPHIWGLMIPSSRKAPILILFLLSAFVLVASSTRLYYIIHFDAATFRSSWATDRSVLWSTLEHCFGIIGISMPSLRPILKSVYDHFKSTSEMTVATESNEPPPVMQRPRMGSVEYWKRLQFQSMSSRRPSDVLELEIDVAPPRRLSATEGALKETASRSISRDRQQAMQDSLR